jgi:N-carbamoylputrescine amidase
VSSKTSPIEVAAVQLHAELGAVDKNLSRVEALAREAFGRGAEWVILPEFFPTAVAFSPAMLSAWQPLEGPALQLMRKLARTHDGVVGGSFIAKSGRDCFNSFLLVFPDGHYYRHDKDLPSLWENCYYVGGSDDGVLDTPIGPIGVALCWEFIRSRTPQRLRGKVGAVVGGSCWWDLRLPVAEEYVEQQRILIDLQRLAPVNLARMLGVPVVHASHVGEFAGLTPGDDAVPYVSRYLGETQIVDASGKVLARMTYEDGEGVIVAEITPQTSPGGIMPVPTDFWSVELPPTALKAWEGVNKFGRQYYEETFRPLLESES